MRFLALTHLLLLTSLAFSTSTTLLPNYPEEKSYLVSEDFFIALSANDSLETALSASVLEKGVKLTLDNAPLIDGLTWTEGVVVYQPSALATPLKPGPHLVKAQLFDENGNLLSEVSWSFSILGEEKPKSEESKKRFHHSGRLFTSTTHNTLAGNATLDLDLGAAYRARFEKWHYSADLYLTSQESNLGQPRNLYSAAFGYGKNLEFKLGDIAPSFNPLAISGQRIRGFEFNSALYSKKGNQVFSLDAAYGEAIRAVKPSLIKSETSDSNWNLGTFSRSLLCARLATGAGEAFQFGLLFVKGRDDTGSVRAPANDTLYFAQYTPKDNVVIGADISSKFFKERIELFGSYALSLYTRDITHGAVSEEDLDSVLNGVDLPLDPAALGSFLIVNTSTTPFSPYGEGIMNSAALEGGIRLAWANTSVSQNLEVKYQDIGPNYYSSAAPLLGASRTGFTVSEQLALFNNRLSLNGGFNTFVNGAGNELSQTKEHAYHFGLSLWHSPTYPSLSFGFNSSGVENKDSLFGFNNSVGSFNASSQYGLTTAGGTRHNIQLFTARTGIENGWTNSILLKDSPDSIARVGDSFSDTSLSVSTLLYSVAWSMQLPENPLFINGSFMGNSGSRDFVRVLSWNAGASYTLLPGKLTLTTQLGFSSLHRPTDTDTRTQLRFKYGASYRPHPDHSFRLEGSTLSGTGKPDFRNRFYYEFRF